MTSVHCRPGTLGRMRELSALSVAELPGGGIPVAEPQRGVVESVGHDRVPARRSGPVRELAQQAAERLAGEEVGLDERDREPEREHDPHADEQPGERVERALAHPDHEHGEVEDEQRRHEQQRGRGDLGERPPLRSRRCPEAPDPDGCDAGDDGKPDVGDERRHACRAAPAPTRPGTDSRGRRRRRRRAAPRRRASARGAATRRRRAPGRRPASRAAGASAVCRSRPVEKARQRYRLIAISGADADDAEAVDRAARRIPATRSARTCIRARRAVGRAGWPGGAATRGARREPGPRPDTSSRRSLHAGGRGARSSPPAGTPRRRRAEARPRPAGARSRRPSRAPERTRVPSASAAAVGA